MRPFLCQWLCCVCCRQQSQAPLMNECRICGAVLCYALIIMCRRTKRTITSPLSHMAMTTNSLFRSDRSQTVTTHASNGHLGQIDEILHTRLYCCGQSRLSWTHMQHNRIAVFHLHAGAAAAARRQSITIYDDDHHRVPRLEWMFGEIGKLKMEFAGECNY